MYQSLEKMLVVVFDDETKAYQASSALKDLDSEDSISIHAEAVVKKNPDGTLATKQFADEFPIRTATGTAIGALIGLLGGPIGVGIGAATGMLAGSVADLDRSGVDADYLKEVSDKLTPGKWAVVGDISEEWETPVDTKMEALGGTVFRANRETFVKERNTKEEAAMKDQAAHLKEEQAHATQADKAKIQKKIDNLNAKLQVRTRKAKEQIDQDKLETEAKIHALEVKSKKARGDAKAKIEARIASLREKSKEPEQQQQQQPVQAPVPQQ